VAAGGLAPGRSLHPRRQRAHGRDPARSRRRARPARDERRYRPLDARCTYRIGTTTPQARFWTLTLYDAAGRPVDTPLGRSGFSSAELLREQNGAFTIFISREAESGNWLMMPESGELSLALRLYDSPASVGSAALEGGGLPRIERLECRP
jgi:hypothetical protein